MKRALVAYFSVSGVTAKLAQKLAGQIGADVFEIQALSPYTQEDLDWRDSKSRSTVEMKDPACRPPMAEIPQGIRNYDLIFVGFPIWWYRHPSIIDSFLESADFSGKTIVPFTTHAGPGEGEAFGQISRLCPASTVLPGLSLVGNTNNEMSQNALRGRRAAEAEQQVQAWLGIPSTR
mgnify:CR=1 FL=1